MGGILAGTYVATPNGWRAVETLLPGDVVLTFESGPQALVRVERLALPEVAEIGLRLVWPLKVPVGAMENRQGIVLLPEQRVLIESDAAEELYGQPFVLVPAAALMGFRGIDLCPVGARPAFSLQFAADQIIYGGRGMLLHCPSPASKVTEYPLLTAAQARTLVAGMMAEDLGRSLYQTGYGGGQAAFT
ncbi:Hint domain-containing protein [Rhodobacter ferrooxidans]|uniref:Hedgehog/Intein (Hint) domain-containing protein n=1 Tax=Rhodobacter ferrooxidans TaxID=371731 RepID=C8RXL0_9RHOB|nr:Hint domain-containing protein [Rhodobacter sp. SW2]EEW26735.1 conserved hypothetical protein [Rhodobacter sp. SW2]